MSKLKIGIIGVGGISEYHIKGYLADPRCELYAFCDINPTRLHQMGEQYGITRLYTDKDEMLAACPEIDAVSVCTWNSAHAACTIAALNAGKHVLCEKPMAINTAEAEEMKAVAEKNGKLLMIGFVRRHRKDTGILKRFIDADDLGEIYYGKATYLRRAGAPGGWFGDRSRSGGGPMIDLGVHVIDLARYLAGRPQPVSVYAATFHKLGNRGGLTAAGSYQSASAEKEIFDVEDMATALIRFDNGFVLSVETSFCLNIEKETLNLELCGTKAGAVIEPQLRIFTDRHGQLIDYTFHDDTSMPFDLLFHEEIRHYLDCILDGKECVAPAEDGVTLMRILDAAYESAATGHEVIL